MARLSRPPTKRSKALVPVVPAIKAAPADPPTPPDPLEKLREEFASLALKASDEMILLKEAHRAAACLESLLVPVELPRSDEFYVTPTELRALVHVVNVDIERRMLAVHATVESMRLAARKARLH